MAAQSYGTGVVLVLAAGLLWSAMTLGLRVMAEESTWAVLAWRSAGLALCLGAVITWQGGLSALWRGVDGWVVVGAVALATCFAGAIYAVQITTATNATFPIAVTPLVSALLARVLLAEPIRPATWGAIALAAVGVGVMVAEGLEVGQLTGTLVALASAACFAVFTVALRRARGGDNLQGVFWGGVAAVLLGVLGALIAGESPLMSGANTGLALGLGLILLGGGLWLFAQGSRSVPAGELSLLSLTEVLLAPFWVWLVLAEVSSPMTFLGAAIVLVAIVVNAWSGLANTRMA